MADVDTTTVDNSFAASEAGDDQTSHNNTASATVGTRRQANGTIGSVYSGNKIKHLKKDDGIPLWRKDIQYQFLKLVFEDQTRVFTRYSDGAKNLDFADVYIDCMARSSKTSKILKDKLQSDKKAAISMAMVCLLVNFGRMNTTLNFFPEMRAQLRTYHSIPSLQADQDPNAYKQLQDAPRLKSILKGASEDVEQPPTIERVRESRKPRTNPVHLIFLLAQYAPKISEIHFFQPRDFFDLVMRSTLSSRSRARAFLWLMWWYLESDFTREDALNNPFGPGLDGEGTGGLPIKVPAFEILTEEQAEEENRDTPEEIRFGEEKQRERKRILEEDEPLPRIPKRVKKHDSGLDDELLSANSTPLHPSARRIALNEEEEDWSTPGSSAHLKSKKPNYDSSVNRSTGQRLVLKTRMDPTSDAASPAPPGSGHPILNQYATDSMTPNHNHSSRRPRPLTQHQLAVEQNRRHRIEYLLAQRKTQAYKVLRARRENEPTFNGWMRLLPHLPEPRASLDGDDIPPEISQLMDASTDYEDFGETAHYYLSVTRKAIRRLDRWDWEKINGPSKDRKKAREERQKAFQNGTALMGGGGRGGQSSRSARSRPRPPRRKPAPTTSTPSSAQKPIAPKDEAQDSKFLSDAVDKSGSAVISSSRDNEPFDDAEKDVLGEGSGHDEDDSELSYPEDDEHDDDDDLEDVEGEHDYSIMESRNDYDTDSEDEVNGDGEQGGDEDEVMEDQ
ncbi:INO80 chromatin remodeling complex (Ies1), putative [Talaromyces stipitatus ATCC 10500]|uniref:INO80 chromatin remodeling complex (Ies1), putative n=1 Tax=Talaromyces stipitatus (strain ATCC 10500 / CBS 375.48 / QM 6759 / NRRL 1006) TaxID=441959 RepID=B8MK93_TALSN|nr:INO80 chromatin remodeling complex (Ies1), putative [Talaromyces stipitatus ATCC 10500]EED15248.1 INO80 chromatin remodeling complex (Ies1), putative [Talaromyces stipitatus ATCC 10500]